MTKEDFRVTFARRFAEPLTTDWHREMELQAWIGGPYVSVPYYLSRLQGINYFAVANEELDAAVERYVVQQYSSAAAILFRDRNLWYMIGILLHHRFFIENGRESPGRKIEIAACEEYLRDPHATDETLARRVGTTVKQIQRYGGWITQARRDFKRLNK